MVSKSKQAGSIKGDVALVSMTMSNPAEGAPGPSLLWAGEGAAGRPIHLCSYAARLNGAIFGCFLWDACHIS
jgi:hypothetical protein